jgi:hypothetical protein
MAGLYKTSLGLLGPNPFARAANTIAEGSIIEDPLRRMAWTMTAGSFDVLWCYDIHFNKLYRDAEPGSVYGWDADHIIPRELGGTDSPLNLRALHSSVNRSNGANLGNAMQRYRRS